MTAEKLSQDGVKECYRRENLSLNQKGIESWPCIRPGKRRLLHREQKGKALGSNMRLQKTPRVPFYSTQHLWEYILEERCIFTEDLVCSQFYAVEEMPPEAFSEVTGDL